MASPVKVYQKEMHENIGFFATWLPGDRIEVGDAGILEAGRFRRMASLQELGISIGAKAGGRTQELRYTSSSGTSLAVDGGADAVGVVKARVTIEFSRIGAFLFHASRLQARMLENRLGVAEQLVLAYEEGAWKREWLLVDSIYVAEHATIAVSQDSSAALTLGADVSAGLLTGSLADPSLSLRVLSTRGTVVSVIGDHGTRPLYSCLRLKDPLLGAPSVHPVRGRNLPPENAFGRPSIQDLLNS
jgi:hypothetical protein